MSDELVALPPIAAALESIPKGANGAFLFGVTTAGAEVELTARVGRRKQWSVSVKGDWDFREQPIASLVVKKVW